MITFTRTQLNKKPLAEGGESLIYEYNNDIAKIFKSCVDKPQKKVKIEKMISLNLPSGVVGPKDIIVDENGKFIGYTMARVEGEEFKKLCSKKYLKLNNISIKNICKMLAGMVEIINILHKNNVIIGDLNECNILFDKLYNIHIIDVDSWSIAGSKCTVAMESFQDPKMTGTNFTKETDWYAFSILVFKSLTMLHPFGGNTSPEIPILDRMKKGLSVIDNNKVIIPKTLCKDWSFMSPDLLVDLKKIFDKGERFSIEASFMDFAINLTQCAKHKDFYYSKYSQCPICNENVTILDKLKPVKVTRPPRPKKVAPVVGIPCVAIYTSGDIKVMLDANVYVDNLNVVHFLGNAETYPYKSNVRYYQYLSTTVVSNKTEFAINNGKQTFKFDKLRGSRIMIRGESLFYTSNNNVLTELKYNENGNVINALQHVSFNNFIEVYNREHYLIYNNYDATKIICIDGYNHELAIDYGVNNYGMHYDPITNNWMLIIEDNSSCFHTKVFNKDKIIYENDNIKLSCDLGDLCHYNGVLYIPKDSAIRGFNYMTNNYKDFQCSAITSDSTLIKSGKKFTIIKEDGIFEIG